MAETMGIKLDEGMKVRLKALGEVRDRSAHWLAKKAINEFLEREEAYEREKREDMAEWEGYLQTGEAIPGEKVVSWLKDMGTQRTYVEWHE